MLEIDAGQFFELHIERERADTGHENVNDLPAEAVRKNAEKEAAERNSPEGKLKEETGNLKRYIFAKKCEDAFLDIGYDLKCLDDETGKKLMIVGSPVNRVFVHKVASTFHPNDLKRMGFRTLEFWNGAMFSSYSETFDLGR